MLSVRPFRGVRFASRSLTPVLCPPYDVIREDLASKLRRRGGNAIEVELPAGEGTLRYARARRTWRRWLDEGRARRDPAPAFYLIEETFRRGGRAYRRSGVLAELGLDAATARRVLPHERTLSKHKADRTRLLKALQVNTSPIFGIYHDPGGAIRRLLAAARRGRPYAEGTAPDGTACRLWRNDDPMATAALSRAFRAKKLLIADGHHRYEVARRHCAGTRGSGADGILAYLVAEEDPGLLVFPTHRVLRPGGAVRAALERRCRARRAGGLAALERALARARSPYAFGVFDGGFRMMLPAPGDRGVPTGFGTEWLSRNVLASVDAHDIAYFHGAREAVRGARRAGGMALLVKPFSVADIRRAVERGGLLPQKSTYFYPKIATGLVFRPLR